jgi:hypothetical protein
VTIVEKVKDALAAAPSDQTMSDELRRLSEFNAEMKRLGIAKQYEYDLPLLDTIGRHAHRSPVSPKSR